MVQTDNVNIISKDLIYRKLATHSRINHNYEFKIIIHEIGEGIWSSMEENL